MNDELLVSRTISHFAIGETRPAAHHLVRLATVASIIVTVTITVVATSLTVTASSHVLFYQ